MANQPNASFLTSLIKLQVCLGQRGKFHLERIRLEMKAASNEETVGRAFKEFLEKHGYRLVEVQVDTKSLGRLGLAAAANVSVLKPLGMMEIWMPKPEDPDFLQKLKEKLRLQNVNQLFAAALEAAYSKYVMKSD